HHAALDMHVAVAEAGHEVAVTGLDHGGRGALRIAEVGADGGEAPVLDGDVGAAQDLARMHVHPAAVADQHVGRRPPHRHVDEGAGSFGPGAEGHASLLQFGWPTERERAGIVKRSTEPPAADGRRVMTLPWDKPVPRTERAGRLRTVMLGETPSAAPRRDFGVSRAGGRTEGSPGELGSERSASCFVRPDPPSRDPKADPGAMRPPLHPSCPPDRSSRPRVMQRTVGASYGRFGPPRIAVPVESVEAAAGLAGIRARNGNRWVGWGQTGTPNHTRRPGATSEYAASSAGSA